MQFAQVFFLSDDLKATKNFYHGKLGFTILSEEEAYISFAAGKTALTFVQAIQESAFYHFAFNIPPSQFDEALQWAEGRVQLLASEPGVFITDFEDWNARSFYFYDNNNNIVEFIARFDLSAPAQSPFDANAILSVSEMSMVVDDVAATVRHISDTYGLLPFSKQKPRDNFAAMGDDYGLLLIAQKDRIWYPTNLAARPHIAIGLIG